MKSSIFLLLDSLYSYKIKRDNPICVVGGGIIGLSIARRFKKNGENVIVFEKDSRVGGKAQTFREGKKSADVGALFIPKFNKRAIKLAKELNSELVITKRDTLYYYDEENGDATLYNPFGEGDEGSILSPKTSYDALTVKSFLPLAKIGIYFFLIAKFLTIREELQLDYGHLTNNKELFIPFSEWLDNNGLAGLKEYLSVYLVYQGYGEIETIPAIYHLTFFSVNRIKTLNDPKQEFYTFKNGFDNFVKNLSKGLKIYKNAKVLGINLELGNNSLSYTQSSQTYIQRCDRIIMAVPPTKRFYSKIDSTSLFDEVRAHRYMTQVFRDEGLKNSYYLQDYTSEDLGRNKVLAVIKQKGLFTTYSWHKVYSKCYQSHNTSLDLDCEKRYNSNGPFKDMIKKANNLMPKIERIKNATNLYQKEWAYFPHVTKKGLENGFFNKLDKLQGHCGLYIASTILSFELIENSLGVVDFMFDRYFSKNQFKKAPINYGNSVKNMNGWSCSDYSDDSVYNI